MMSRNGERRIKVFRGVIKYMKFKINFAFPEDEITARDSTIILRFVAPVVLTGSISLIGTVGFFFMALKNGQTSDQVLSFSILFQYSMLYLILYIVYLNGPQWIIFLHELSEYKYGKPPKSDEMYKTFDRWATYIYYSLKILTLLQFIYALATNSFCDGWISGDHRYICGSSIPLWYPIEIKSQIVRAMLIVGGHSITFFHYPVVALYALTFFGCIQLIVLRVQHLKILLSKVIEYQTTEQQMEKQLYKCIKCHSEIVRLMKSMNVALDYTLIPYYAALPFLLAMYGYLTFHINDLSMPIILMCWFVIVSSLSLAGQRLETESSSLLNSVYELPFYNFNRNLRKDYQLFLTRVGGKPLNIGIKSLAQLNNEFYVAVLKGCYSYMMFFLQMSRKQKTAN